MERQSSSHQAPSSTDDIARQILTTTRTWAVVGASPRPHRPSNRVADFLRSRGFDVVPVNPTCEEVLGLPTYPDLASIPHPVDTVDIFRRSSHAGVHVDEAIEVGARAVWMQLGVIDEQAARRAREAGLLVVMDRCPAIEHPRLIE